MIAVCGKFAGVKKHREIKDTQWSGGFPSAVTLGARDKCRQGPWRALVRHAEMNLCEKGCKRVSKNRPHCVTGGTDVPKFFYEVRPRLLRSA